MRNHARSPFKKLNSSHRGQVKCWSRLARRDCVTPICPLSRACVRAPHPWCWGTSPRATSSPAAPGVTDLAEGDHVILVFVPSCGCCVPCAEGRPALCEPGAAANTAGTLLSGERRLRRQGGAVSHHVGVSCFAEYAVVSRRSCVKINVPLGHAEAALFGCAVANGRRCRGQHRARASRRHNVPCWA